MAEFGGRCRKARLLKKVPESKAFEEDAGKRGFGERGRKARLLRKVPESEAFDEVAGKRGF